MNSLNAILPPMTTPTLPKPTLRQRLLAASLIGCTLLPLGCGGGSGDDGGSSDAPNIIWIVWDTTRADRMSLYGHGRDTTPFLDEWTKNARVFENCSSTGCSTVPSHAGMFTGKLPTEHGTRFGHQWLENANDTAAELLRDAGYQTYLWAANPHISAQENFVQGFDTVEHPWDPESREKALQMVWRKLRRDKSSELKGKIQAGQTNEWMIKAAGGLAEEGLTKWLDKRDKDRPYLAFINYMEAHRPFIPPARYRRRMMSEEDVNLSFEVDRSWVPMWAYTFGLHEYTQKELDIMAATYDACIAELDDLFKSLVENLGARGELDNTVIILTGDHGEHLGEHHMMDHQYSLYDALIHVPLIVYAPDHLKPGRDARPVANYDIFPTVLELAGVDPSKGPQSTAQSLLSPGEDRPILAELPATFTEPFLAVGKVYPHLDPKPWTRKLKAFRYRGHKLVWSSNGDHELYHPESDPLEANNLIDEKPELAKELMAEFEAYLETLMEPLPKEGGTRRPMSAQQLEMLKKLGYVADDDEELDEE